MSKMMIIHDEDARGNRYHSVRLPNDKSSLSVEELIRLRVENEGKRFNVERPVCFYSLVHPEGVEQTTKGYRLKQHREVDWQAQCEIAVEAFKNKAFLININGCDYQSLEDTLKFDDESEISFVKFSDIIGG